MGKRKKHRYNGKKIQEIYMKGKYIYEESIQGQYIWEKDTTI